MDYSTTILFKKQLRQTIKLSNSIPKYILKRTEDMLTQKNMYIDLVALFIVKVKTIYCPPLRNG